MRSVPKRGITVVHYTYYQLAFCQGIPRECFSVDRQGKPQPPYDRLENEDRLCASNPKALGLYREGVREYMARAPRQTATALRHPRRRKLLCVRQLSPPWASRSSHALL